MAVILFMKVADLTIRMNLSRQIKLYFFFIIFLFLRFLFHNKIPSEKYQKKFLFQN